MRLQPLPDFEPFGQPVIAEDKVRYVGEALAVVLADTAGIAEDALGLIEVDIESLPAVADILGRDHAMHAGERACRRNIDRAQAAMGDRAAQDGRMQHFLAREVVDILPAAADEAQILEPLDRAADQKICRLHAAPSRFL